MRQSIYTFFLIISLLSQLCLAIDPPMKAATAVKIAAGSIVIDGKLDDAGWKTAPVHSGFEVPTARADRPTIPSNMQTFVQIAWDDETLYFGLRCNEPNITGMHPYPAPEVWDAAMWANDCIELFFDPTGTRDCYYHFAAGPNGAQYDAFWSKGQNLYYSSAWQSKAVVEKDHWSVEFAIPLATLNMVPASLWVDTWILTVCRSAPGSSGGTMYSPTEGFHQIKQSGPLSGMPAALADYCMTCEAVSFTLAPDETGTLGLLPTFTLYNHTSQPFNGLAYIQTKGGTSASNIHLPAATNTTVTLPRLPGISAGAITINLSIKDGAGNPHLVRRFDDTLEYVPLAIRITEPGYRNSIYPSQKTHFGKVRGSVTLGMAPDLVTNCTLHMKFRSATSDIVISATNLPVTGSDIAFKLPTGPLQEQDYVVEATLESNTAGEKPVATTSTVVTCLPQAPAVEVRIDGEGNILVDGNSVIFRGFYGGMSRNDPEFFRLPRSINHMGSDSPEIWQLVDVKQLVDEPNVKNNPPIDETLTNKIKAVVASVRNRPNVIGYYLEEDCGGRGVPASYLKKFYDILKAEDPYRIVLLTESPYPGTLAACDVLCNRQWRKVAVDEAGNRRFVEDVTRVGEAITETLQVPGKASWCGPQAFAYAEELGDARLRHLTPMEQRFIMLDCLARGTRGFTCHGIWNYLANMASRRAIESTFDEMAWLDQFWRQPGAGRKATSDNPAIRLGARSRFVAQDAPQLFAIIAVNESTKRQKASITIDGLSTGEVQVLRENRLVSVSNGVLIDTFEPQGVHVYTTVDPLPPFESPEAIWADILAGAEKVIASGNLLAQHGLRYRVSGSQFNMDGTDPTTDRFQWVDGNVHQNAWTEGDPDGKACRIVFEKPVTFSMLAMQSQSILGADLEAEVNGKWTTLTSWTNIQNRTFEWTGLVVTAKALRINATATRNAGNGPARAGITELGIYNTP